MLYRLGGKTIRAPFGLPSGTVGISAPTIELLAHKIPQLGFITTKSISALPHKGHKPPIFAQFEPYSGINAVGLDNPGAEAFAEDLAKIKLPKDFFLLVSIFGADPDEFISAAKPLIPFADGFELNFSCPHSDKFGLKVGENLDLAIQIIKAILALGKPVFVKLSPKMDITYVVNNTQGLGIAGYTAINTLGPTPFLIDGKAVLTNKVGGLSGRAITDVALRCIREVRHDTRLTIIGCGGISTGEDVCAAMRAGANFYAIGTGLMGMDIGQKVEYFRLLTADVRNGSNKAATILASVAKTVWPNMVYRPFTVAENRTLAEDLFFLRFKEALISGENTAGQFVFAWLPEKGERPFSILTDSPLSLLIGIKGECTRLMSCLRPGDSIYIRGPHGKVPKLHGKILLVGGGTGMAGLLQLAQQHGEKTTALLGAKDKKHLFDGPFRECCQAVYSHTEKDGPEGMRGLVTDFLEAAIRLVRPDFCLNCGPEPMIKKAIGIEQRMAINQRRILSSVELYTACGVGICGQCASPRGFSACVDGSFMAPYQLGL